MQRTSVSRRSRSAAASTRIPESNNVYHASVVLELTDQTCDVVLKRLALTLSGAGETTIDPCATVDGTTYRVAGEVCRASSGRSR